MQNKKEIASFINRVQSGIKYGYYHSATVSYKEENGMFFVESTIYSTDKYTGVNELQSYELGEYKTEAGAKNLVTIVSDQLPDVEAPEVFKNDEFNNHLKDVLANVKESKEPLQFTEAVEEYTPTPEELEAASHIQGDAYLIIDDQDPSQRRVDSVEDIYYSLEENHDVETGNMDIDEAIECLEIAEFTVIKIEKPNAPKEQYAVWDSWANYTKLYIWDELLDLLSVESGFNYDVNGMDLDTLSIALEDYHLYVTPVGVFPHDARNAGTDVELVDTYVAVKSEGCHVQSYIYVDDVLHVYNYGVMSLDCAVSLRNRLSTFTHVDTEKLLQDDLVHAYRLFQNGAKEICVLQDQLDNDNRMIVSAQDAIVMGKMRNGITKEEPMEQWEAVEILEANDYAVTCISIQKGWN